MNIKKIIKEELEGWESFDTSSSDSVFNSTLIYFDPRIVINGRNPEDTKNREHMERIFDVLHDAGIVWGSGTRLKDDTIPPPQNYNINVNNTYSSLRIDNEGKMTYGWQPKILSNELSTYERLSKNSDSFKIDNVIDGWKIFD